jgi:hypothetical protein
MSKSLRLSEKWFRFGLWIVAIVFAGFLTGLGSTVVENLPQVEHSLSVEEFIDKPAAAQAAESIRAAEHVSQDAQEKLEQLRVRYQSAQRNTADLRESFNHWLATRSVTQRGEQDAEVISRTRDLDRLKAVERKAQEAVETQEQQVRAAQEQESQAQASMRQVEGAAQENYWSEMRRQELRVFGYRLLLTLPLLGIAGWLFAKKRKSAYWPFVWGFIYFALFAFFVELVPYLPSYGGYVRYVVGILITVLVGRYAIVALNNYLEKQKQAEALPDAERRKDLSYDTALARLAKKVCPGCERPVDLTNTAIDYCPHCGICLFDHCAQCNERKSAFARFCHACGAGAKG